MHRGEMIDDYITQRNLSDRAGVMKKCPKKRKPLSCLNCKWYEQASNGCKYPVSDKEKNGKAELAFDCPNDPRIDC
jgi:hypothetical protein